MIDLRSALCASCAAQGGSRARDGARDAASVANSFDGAVGAAPRGSKRGGRRPTASAMSHDMKIGFTAVIRVEQTRQIGTFAKIADAIARTGGRIGAVDVSQASRRSAVRDITVEVGDEDHLKRVVDEIAGIEGTHVVDVSDRTFLAHLGGKIEVVGRIPLNNRDALSRVY